MFDSGRLVSCSVALLHFQHHTFRTVIAIGLASSNGRRTCARSRSPSG